MLWLSIVGVIVVGFLVLKFLVKPLFKILALLVLGYFVWHLLTSSI